MLEQMPVLRKALIWAAAIALLGGGIWLYLWLRKRRGRTYARVLNVDKSNGEIWLEVNGATKRVFPEPGMVKAFSPAGYALLVPTEVDKERNRVTQVKLYVYRNTDEIIPAETQTITLT